MSISEDAAVGDVIGSVTAVDVDADDSVLQFSVSEAHVNTSFGWTATLEGPIVPV